MRIDLSKRCWSCVDRVRSRVRPFSRSTSVPPDFRGHSASVALVACAIGVVSMVLASSAAAEVGAVPRLHGTNVQCTSVEKAERVAAVKAYAAQMQRARRMYFRSHRSTKARRAFVQRQQAKLHALAGAAACAVLPAGAQIAATIAIPNDGPLALTPGAVWVVDRAGGVVDSNDTPEGSLLRVDANTNTVTDQIRGVVGAQAAAGFGAVWLAAFAIDAVLRIDTTTHAVERLRSGPSDDEGPDGVATTATGVWVANHHAGTVVELDPATRGVVRTVPVADQGPDGPSDLLVTGDALWVAIPQGRETIAELSTATATVLRRAPVPGGVCGQLAADSVDVWVAGADCSDESLSAVDRQSGRAVEVARASRPGYRPNGVAVAFGSVWVTVNSPAQVLRIDPTTRQVVGGMALPEDPSEIVAGNDALWVRAHGLLLRLTPEP